ncbi:MAG: proteobacterial dedicated sortase system histidine kinase [endosymbiont of Galathealinum brachiosum]|uniref:histidine kinase n=1 Tax=endosymbiont of Galathealinum brachiosum TaxID=2200906 RepID=A0A370DF63_9GAMM|nr:MAG: proteobacterial dedicated sortase system histidine kinase [endosymbiont of Galathealinum brachiosum]
MIALVLLKLFMVWVIAGLKIRITIRSKLLIISAVLFVVPWIGVQYIQDMENFLRINQEENLLGKAQIVAAVLQGQSEIFKSRENSAINGGDSKNSVNNSSHVYVRPIKRAIQLDGYMDDWLDYDGKSKLIKSENPLSFQYKYYLASYKKYLYMVLEVKDDQLVYRKANSLSLDKNDHVIIKLRNKEGEFKTYFIATESPGWINAHRMERYQSDEWVSKAPELRIKGEWQETPDGYNVEIRVPLSLIGDGFSFFVADVDDERNRGLVEVLGESKITEALGSIIIPSPKIEEMLKRIVRPASRTWVIDQKYRVLAVAGNIRENGVSKNEIAEKEEGVLSKVVSVIYGLLLKQPAHNFKDELSSVSYLRGSVVQSALEGEPSTSWRDTPDKQVRIITASYPVVVNGEPIGAIAIEETSNAILILQNRAMEILINLSVLTFLITVIVLLSYATRLSVRIRRLRDETEQAITTEGRIEKTFKITKSTDEIGDLSRSFSGMLSRLAEYNRYLETMAGKLSHELRTPITVVRSSLENLQMTESDEARSVYIQRASEGMGRLSDILTRMSEATRLEQTLQSETMQDVDLCELTESCVAGYRMAYPDVDFVMESDSIQQCYISGVPELLAQMLDKLVSNAVDFHIESTPVTLKVNMYKNRIQLSVVNKGENLPDSMRENLFESMVSVRSKRGDRPHLGLGLYIVRMIVEFHRGSVQAVNLEGESGVMVLLDFPLR